jgi:hypothetical protein
VFHGAPSDSHKIPMFFFHDKILSRFRAGVNGQEFQTDALPEIQVTRIGVNESWRGGLPVTFRL